MNVVIDGIRYVPAPLPCENPSLLDVVFACNDLDRNVSMREYLGELLSTLWAEGEGFSGKRPFGNSCWEYDLYRALILAKAIEGDMDEDGCINEITKAEKEKANMIIFGLIGEMARAK